MNFLTNEVIRFVSGIAVTKMRANVKSSGVQLEIL